MLFAWFFKLTSYIPLKIAYRLRVYGKRNLPKTPCILISNHSAPIDPCLINLAVPMKRIHFLTSPHLFDCPGILRWMLRSMGCHPSVSPTADIDYMKQTALNLKRYELIGYFAEGQINGGVKNFKSGAVVLAVQTGLPVVPVYLCAAGGKNGRSYVCFGEPVPYDSRELSSVTAIEAFNDTLRQKVIQLSMIPQ